MTDNRPTKSSSGRSDSLQALRGLAFLGIFLGHFIAFGWTPISVSAFFILSGFLLSLKKNADYEKYSLKDSAKEAVKRISKLYPLHIILMIACIPTEKMLSEGLTNAGLLARIAANVFLVQSLYPSAEFAASLNGVAWFLSTILILYIVFPFVYRLLKKIKSTKALILLILIGITIQTVFIYVIFHTFTSADAAIYMVHCFPGYRVFELAYGIILGLIAGRAREKRTLASSADGSVSAGSSAIWDNVLELFVFAVTVGLVIYWTGPTNSLYIAYAPVCPILSMLWVVVFYRKSGIVTKLLTGKATVFAGNMSGYAFLIHFVILRYNVLYIVPHVTFLQRTIKYFVMLPGYILLTLLLSYVYDCIIRHKKISLPESVKAGFTKEKMTCFAKVAGFFAVSGICRIVLGFGEGIWMSTSGDDVNVLVNSYLWNHFTFPVESSLLYNMSYSVFLYFVGASHIPYAVWTGLIWVACGALGFACVRILCRSRILPYLSALYLMFLPVAFDEMSGTMISRNSLICPFVIMTFLLMVIVAAVAGKKGIITAGLLGLVFAFTYYLREDMTWLLVCFIVWAAIGIIQAVIAKRKDKILLFVMPVAVLLCCALGYRMMNYHYFGSFVINDGRVMEQKITGDRAYLAEAYGYAVFMKGFEAGVSEMRPESDPGASQVYEMAREKTRMELTDSAAVNRSSYAASVNVINTLRVIFIIVNCALALIMIFAYVLGIMDILKNRKNDKCILPAGSFIMLCISFVYAFVSSRLPLPAGADLEGAVKHFACALPGLFAVAGILACTAVTGKFKRK